MSVWKLNITLIVEERKCFPAHSEGHVQNVVKVMSNGRLPGAQEGSGRAGSSSKGAASHSWFSNGGTVDSRSIPLGPSKTTAEAVGFKKQSEISPTSGRPLSPLGSNRRQPCHRRNHDARQQLHRRHITRIERVRRRRKHLE